MRLRAKQLRRRAEAPAEQETREEPPKGDLCSGLRVVDLSTHVAGPSVSRVLADLGAEVVKVEPPLGDPMREFFLKVEAPRAFSTAFEFANLNKASACLDVSSAEGKTALLGLLQDADVLVTNLRPCKLERMGLSHGEVTQMFPQLIFAQVTAWGTHGAAKHLAGFDIGAFWAATGVTTLMHDPDDEMYSSVPVGGGDLTMAQHLVAGIAMALAQRLSTGRGQYLEASLLHAGSWVMGPYVAEETGPTSHISLRRADPLYTTYQTSDGAVAVLGFAPRPGTAAQSALDHRTELCKALGIPPALALTDEGILLVKACAEMRKLTSAAAMQTLKHHRIASTSCNTIRDVSAVFKDSGGPLKPADRLCVQSSFVASPTSITDLSSMPMIPYQFAASASRGAAQGIRQGAPRKGAHTDDVLKRGWLGESLGLPRTTASFQGVLDPPLSDCVVVELVEFEVRTQDLAVPAAGRYLLERGATVFRVEPRDGDPLRKQHPGLYDFLNAGKKVVRVGSLAVDGNEQVQTLLQARANVLVTNMDQASLAHLDLDAASLRARCPGLAIVNLRSYRVETQETVRHRALGALYASTGLGGSFSGKRAQDLNRPPMPAIDMIVSTYVASAVALAWFHVKRTGEAQVVDVYLDSIGHWMMQMFSGWFRARPDKFDFVDISAENFHDKFPMPTANSFCLKDGTWVQLMGMSSHLHRTFRALGIAHTAWPRVVAAAVRHGGVALVMGDSSAFHGLQPVIMLINRLLARGMACYDLAEFSARAKAFDVWFTPIREPKELLRFKQCHRNSVFANLGSSSRGVRVTSPCNMQSERVLS